MVFRRRRLPEHLAAPFEAFEGLVPILERAKSALTESVPSTRLPGRPLAETLWEFEEGLRAVEERMSAWRVREVEAQWNAAFDGLREALALAERLRVEAPEPAGFEGLIGLIADLLAPLEEPFVQAAERFRSLRA